MEIPTYEMLIENELTDAVFAISLVDSPAIQEDYVLLSEDNTMKIELKLGKIIDEKKKIVTGPILVTDQVIPRKGFNIVFRKDTIRKISENFIINGNKDNVTLQHQFPISKVYLVESWIVEDPEKDKSTYLGFNLPAGSWMASYKITDDDLWNEYIETGVLKGFSLEGNFSKKEVHMCEHEEHEDLDKEFREIYLTITYPASDLDSYYTWKTNKADKNCPICESRDNQVKKLSEWITTGIPGAKNGDVVAGITLTFSPGPYSTYCEDACKCKLEKVTKTAVKNPFDKWRK